MVSVLNMNRQIVFVNKLILDMVGATDVQQVIGKRLGELFGCQYAFAVNGCGTSPQCSACGAVRTMLACTKTTESIDECSLTNDEAKITFDLRVHSTYTKAYGEELIICSLFDIGSEKRRGVMERIFFHDIMNTINGINGIAHVLHKVSAEKQPIYMSHLTRLLNSLTEEINSHRVLTLAEKDEYKMAQHTLHSLDFVVEEVEKYQQIAVLEAKVVQISDESENFTFVSDKTLLSRVLSNMIKNALEAEAPGAIIEVDVRKGDDGYLHFQVCNESIISERDQLQIFNRSFSTKGENRGLGTYSMKLLTEKYLNGKISFESKQGKGTTFTVKIPVEEATKA